MWQGEDKSLCVESTAEGPVVAKGMRLKHRYSLEGFALAEFQLSKLPLPKYPKQHDTQYGD